MRRSLLLLMLVMAAVAAASADYGERFRPAYFFSPLKSGINDPNGLVRLAGKYHRFYRYNPLGKTGQLVTGEEPWLPWRNSKLGNSIQPGMERTRES